MAINVDEFTSAYGHTEAVLRHETTEAIEYGMCLRFPGQQNNEYMDQNRQGVQA